MKTRNIVINMMTLLIVALFACERSSELLTDSAVGGLELRQKDNQPTPDPNTKTTNNYKIEPAVSDKNLQVFLISGDEELKDKTYTTLTEAMEKKMVTVKETGSVNQLSIDNKSDDYVFIHSGDIVKGGKQDRTIAFDIIIPPHSTDVPLESFCVESGRWQKRNDEASDEFGSNSKMLSSRKLKLAAKYEKDQSKVWQSVEKQQRELKENVSRLNGYEVEVKSADSETSLQLTLESEELDKVKTEMIEKFKGILHSNVAAIGYAYAINGEILGVDIYNNRKLFEELWPKTSESIVVEALSSNERTNNKLTTVQEVSDFINAMEAAENKEATKALNNSTNMVTKENTDGHIEFSTIDKEENNWLHKNYMKKE